MTWHAAPTKLATILGFLFYKFLVVVLSDYVVDRLLLVYNTAISIDAARISEIDEFAGCLRNARQW